MSSLSWLAYSEAERKRTLDVIHLLGEPQTVDSLGFGRIRDAISDTLFPGTSTIQTRARYFLFVPWIYRDLERRSPLPDVDRRARAAEGRLIESLVRGTREAEGDDSGIIGTRARQGLATLPSAIYWQGLASWGIRRYPGAIPSYHSLLRRADLRHPALDDDGEPLPGSPPPNWDPHLPDQPDDMLDATTLELRLEEAEYLFERITTNHPTSTLAEFLEAHAELFQAPYPWDLPDAARSAISPRNCERLAQAELFSLVANGAALIYNHMLAQAAERSDLEAEYRQRFVEWAAEVEAQHRRLEAWHQGIDELWELVGAVNPRAPGPLEKRFVLDWSGHAVGPDPASLIDDEGVRELIANREYRLKRSNARLRNRTALEAWKGASGSERLGFRWGLVQRLLADIRGALPASRGAPEEVGVA